MKTDYKRLLSAAKNEKTDRIPLYEHIICPEIMEEIMGTPFISLYETNKEAYFKTYCAFFRQMGYDTVSFECCVTKNLQGGGALDNKTSGSIHSIEAFNAYDFAAVKEQYWQANTADFTALRKVLPSDMKVIGGVGNGVFEIVQDLVSFPELCYIKADDTALFASLFQAVGGLLQGIWQDFLRDFSDILAVGRMGDDLGYKMGTLLGPSDVIDHIVPQYKGIINAVHSADTPFLLHSCGKIFDVMEDLLAAGIDAKHSNEDVIAPFSDWIEKYGSRIGNFGGVDTDVLCSKSPAEIKEYCLRVLDYSAKKEGGVAFGTGNSIPLYVPAKGYLAMIDAYRTFYGNTNS